MRTIFAVGHLTREGRRIVVAERRQATRAGKADSSRRCGAPTPRARRLPPRGDFRPAASAPGTVH